MVDLTHEVENSFFFSFLVSTILIWFYGWHFAVMKAIRLNFFLYTNALAVFVIVSWRSFGKDITVILLHNSYTLKLIKHKEQELATGQL